MKYDCDRLINESLMLDWLLEVIKQNITMCPTTEAYTDVVELCALLQCLGFSVKSLNTSDGNVSQENGARTVVINCQASGLHVVLESGSSSCSCPPEASNNNSGVWHVSGIAGGQRLDKEFGCSILGQLPKAHRERLSAELRVMMRCIRESGDIDDKSKEKVNKSASMVEVKMSPERHLLKAETPTRYRSLDTLTAAKEDQQLPPPGLLQKKLVLTDTSTDDVTTDNKKLMCRRQSTYMVSPPGSVKVRNKTSSPLQQPRSVVLESLIAAEKAAEGLRQQLATIIKQFSDEGKDDSSMSSLALDVSKISVLKGTEPMKTQFASSPNLSGLGTVYEDMKKNKLLRLESASTSNLGPKKQTPIKDGGIASKLRRISPNFFKKNTLTIKNDKLKPQDKNSKLNSIFKPKAVTPKLKSESSPNLSASTKKRFSHVKSTIPRPTPKKE
ncbi:uncharacterized protein LOC125231264 isoform X2 [Leguminivora glycinivorella]|uniref:uncharacterized protein LOC125231264 isoform X2 n=1 Tax=Leguminivora glycinivorella TaxID=1035111 RepID=UPI00200F2530|nr:uncharacterized protein LOC125231264 isoform X2 [Leguminivora glycinivorella]